MTKELVVLEKNKLDTLESELRKYKKEGYVYVSEKLYNKQLIEIKSLKYKLDQLNLLSDSEAELIACDKNQLYALFINRMTVLLSKYERKIYDDYRKQDVWCLPPDEYHELRNELFSTE